ncbi:MAG: hypothetical protein WC755_05670, partial [Candidatus Woesearchaeota archaeon]
SEDVKSKNNDTVGGDCGNLNDDLKFAAVLKLIHGIKTKYDNDTGKISEVFDTILSEEKRKKFMFDWDVVKYSGTKETFLTNLTTDVLMNKFMTVPDNSGIYEYISDLTLKVSDQSKLRKEIIIQMQDLSKYNSSKKDFYPYAAVIKAYILTCIDSPDDEKKITHFCEITKDIRHIYAKRCENVTNAVRYLEYLSAGKGLLDISNVTADEREKFKQELF